MSSLHVDLIAPLVGVAPLGHATLRSEHVISAGPSFDAVLPDGGLRRGSVVLLEECSVGMTTMVMSLLGGLPERTWAAWVDMRRSLNGIALEEHGVDLEHLLVVRDVPAAMWTRTVSSLLDAMSVVVAELDGHLSVGDARRLVACARTPFGVGRDGTGPCTVVR